jgi:hypothetical protein
MIKKNFFFISLLTAMLSLTSVSIFAVPVNIPLHAGYEDPNYGNDGLQKGSIPIPSISLDDYSLIFNTPCDGYTLRLLDEDGVVVYSIVIPTDTTSLVLPSTLSGDYQIELVMGYWHFTGWINL